MKDQKKCTIFETFNSVDSLQKKTGADGLMRLSGVFGVCGVVNNNKRIYEKRNYSEKVSLLQETIKREGVPGELEHPVSNTLNITLENVSHKIEDIEIKEDGTITGTICLLNTPKGKIAQAIVEGGLPLYISSRATGSVDRNGVVTLENLKTYDLVGTPGFSQAKLTLNENQSFESLTESLCMIVESEEENNNNNNMTITTEQYQDLVNRLSSIEEASKDFVTKSFLTNEFAPVLESWINDEFAPEFKEDVVDESTESMTLQTTQLFESFVTDKLAPVLESWITEEFAPVIENWITEEFAPVVENWITEEYTPVIEKYLTEEFAPALQDWIVEEYSPEIQNWITEEYSETVSNWIESEVKPDILTESNKVFEGKSKTSLQSIDEMLATIEQKQVVKPTYSRKTIVEGNKDINESLSIVRDMPSQFRPLWNMASTEVKESILSRAKLFNFVNEDSVNKFWSSVDFTATPQQQSNVIVEADARTQAIRESLRKSAVGRSINS